MPGVRNVFKAGDERNWVEIEEWARAIARNAIAGGSDVMMINDDRARRMVPTGLDRGSKAVE
ncbi:MAG: hypothetical protein AB9819_01935 [Methanomassiliicoccales archaeon]